VLVDWYDYVIIDECHGGYNLDQDRMSHGLSVCAGPAFTIGHGIDIVEIRRIAGLIDRSAEDFLEAAFTPDERNEAGSPEMASAFFAGRFAAKEAVVKALGTGFAGDIAWTDVEILRQPTGSANVHLSGGALAVAQSLGVTRWLVSISHDESHAVASAIALGDV
jgi:holo-[acyl-carrier protein] synthase